MIRPSHDTEEWSKKELPRMGDSRSGVRRGIGGQSCDWLAGTWCWNLRNLVPDGSTSRPELILEEDGWQAPQVIALAPKNRIRTRMLNGDEHRLVEALCRSSFSLARPDSINNLIAGKQ